MSDKIRALLDRLLDPTVKFDEIDLTSVAPEDMVYLLQGLRGWAFQSNSMAHELRGTLDAVTETTNSQLVGQDVIVFLAPSSNRIH